MNIRILTASALAPAILVPGANAAPARARLGNDASSVKCTNGSPNLGTDQCQVSGVSFNAKNEPAVVKVLATSSEIDRGTGGSGDPMWMPKAHKLVLVMKANPNLSFSDVGITGRG
jgi:hypothetical protein